MPILILLLLTAISTATRPRGMYLPDGFAFDGCFGLECNDDEQLDELLDVDDELDDDGFT